MQPVSNSGNTSLSGNNNVDAASLKADMASLKTAALTTSDASTTGDTPLTSAQRTVLEKLVNQITGQSGAKSAEVWAGLRYSLGVSGNADLLSSQFTAATQILQARLATAQDAQQTRQLLQQVTSLLQQGNNRQAVSNFIRQQFGHTTLGSLTPSQLQQVVNVLQSGTLSPNTAVATPQPPALPQPGMPTPSGGQPSPPTSSGPLATSSLTPNQLATTANLLGSSPGIALLTGRPLSAAEHNSLNQLVARLVALSGETSAQVWRTMLEMQKLDVGQPIPAQHFQTLSQYLQTQTALLQQHTTSTLLSLLTTLKQPADHQEQSLLQDFVRTSFNAAPQTPLTPTQASEVVTFLYRRRLQQLQESSAVPVQPIINPLILALPPDWRPLFNRPLGLALILTLVAVLLLWILL
ncbi:flagella biosynthesis regulator Flk [Musicola keenii]|uniref:flagella biosynthesis regulator Flk n=1 Tax=Musicola keenii TaxID=2884250 RepID=UPI0017873EC5|nr:flagella biosynthesis regulator Flk [Musicola keenii]